jgi:predicted metalloendopeptidase
MALEKLNKMRVKIGYPTKITKNFKRLDLKPTHKLLRNILNIKRFNIRHDIKKIYTMIDRNEWHMLAHEINAYFSPSHNEIVFPAGILQKPFFSLEQSDGFNFGGIGVIIGHEIIHGFDDQGCKFDGDGNLKNWWTNSDLEKYKKNTNIVKEQYDKHMIEGKNVNGELTLGENIADIGGVTLSFKAFKKYIKNKSDNIKEHQDFFINFANVGKSTALKEYTHHAVLTDPHSPPIWRINGSLPNIKSFYDTFDIKPTDKMWLDNRADIWGSNM